MATPITPILCRSRLLSFKKEGEVAARYREQLSLYRIFDTFLPRSTWHALGKPHSGKARCVAIIPSGTQTLELCRLRRDQIRCERWIFSKVGAFDYRAAILWHVWGFRRCNLLDGVPGAPVFSQAIRVDGKSRVRLGPGRGFILLSYHHHHGGIRWIAQIIVISNSRERVPCIT